jgi:hypothetical protein
MSSGCCSRLVPTNHIANGVLSLPKKTYKMQRGILITASDVQLDCQDFDFRADVQDGSPASGIVVDSANRVTVANCGAESFYDGLQAVGLWTDLTVRSSSFNNNINSGMSLFGDSGSPAEFTVVDSTFNGNGNMDFGVGINSLGARGTISSSTMNNNIGTFGGGLATSGTGALTLVDVEAVENANFGLFGDGMVTLNVTNSLACFNGNKDIVNPTTAQGNTCDTSTPAVIGGLSVCQIPCL